MESLAGRVVVGYDGSPQSGTAVDWAVTEAHGRGLPLVVLHVIDYRGLLPNVMGPPGWPAVFADNAAKIAAAGADRARKQGRGIPVTAVTRTGGVAGALVEASKDAALLVVGTHGRGHLPGVLLGSAASQSPGMRTARPSWSAATPDAEPDRTTR